MIPDKLSTLSDMDALKILCEAEASIKRLYYYAQDMEYEDWIYYCELTASVEKLAECIQRRALNK